VQRVLVRPPASRIGPLNAEERQQRLSRSPFKGRYDDMVDRESAFEMLKARAEEQAELAEQAQANDAQNRPARNRSSRRQSAGEAFIKSAARAIGSQLGRQIIRGIMGSLFGGKR
jgi:hypothetical protein